MKVKRRESSERGRGSFLSVFDGNKEKNRALSPQTKMSGEICKHQGNFRLFPHFLCLNERLTLRIGAGCMKKREMPEKRRDTCTAFKVNLLLTLIKCLSVGASLG